MAKLEVTGLCDLISALERTAGKTEEIAFKSLYKGAKVIADGIKQELESLTVDKKRGNKHSAVTEQEKDDLISNFGIAKVQVVSGEISTKIGFKGFGSTKTKKYPNGVPNQLLIRSINSGTSFRKKNPFIRKTVNNLKEDAVKAMEEEAIKIIKEEFK
ncbi:MAG: hypothetical protein RR531_13530 [Longicatena sp.]